MASEDLLVFVHIHKTAGTALGHWLLSADPGAFRSYYPADDPRSQFLWSDMEPHLADPSVRGFLSHHVRTFPERAFGRRLRYVTLLRDPVACWISHHRYRRQVYAESPRSTWAPYLPEDFLTQNARAFVTWLAGQPAHRLTAYENPQTNFIAEYAWLHDRAGISARQIDWENGEEIFGRYRAERLAFALQTLRRFDLVGTVERLPEFLTHLQRLAGSWDVPLKPIDELPLWNVTAGPPEETSWIDRSDPVGRFFLDTVVADDRELHGYANARLDRDRALA